MKARAILPLTATVAVDTRSPVDDSYRLPFRFSGTINKLTFKLGPEQMTAQDKEEAAKQLAAAHD